MATTTEPSSPSRLIRLWARAISENSYVSMSRRELQLFLTDLSTRLTDGLVSDNAAVAGWSVGAALVGAHVTRPEALQGTLEVLERELPPGDVPRRIPVVLGALAAGYAEALRDLTLVEQESIISAALRARKEAEDARWDSEARFQALFADAAIGISIGTVEGEILDVNNAMVSMFGMGMEQFAQARVTDFVHPDDASDTWDVYGELISGARNHFRMEKPYYRADGSAMWVDLVVSLIRDRHNNPRYMVAMMEDTTQRHEIQALLRHQALHDPLTELPNRTLFFERLDKALANPRRDTHVGLCFLDLDDFKAINDTLGHDVGDRLLQAIAHRLSPLASEGQLVARMGGDEFVVLVEAIESPDQMVGVAESALRAIREPVKLAGQTINITASLGLVERQVDQTDAAELMKEADTTLYWAKEEGRDSWAQFDPNRHAEDVARYELSASLPAAIAEDELFIEYQPLVRLTDERMVGVEALVRWQHPRLGRLDPGQFIGLAEQTGLIAPLGLWVLENACRQAKRWLDRYPDQPLAMSVNLAPRQARDPTIVNDVSRIISESRIEPEQLQLELTESAIMVASGEPLKTLHGLADLGVRIAIDDFGTGYSNLAYLRNLPIHTLKLAGPFIAGLRHAPDTDPVDHAIVDTLIRLAHTLKLRVVAEGVETLAQAKTLRSLSCDAVQGYLYAAPSSTESISQILEEGKPVRGPYARGGRFRRHPQPPSSAAGGVGTS
jgi:diguanylate cyclase (GGDEF)-like protein/PAS domain S-box-containing protein